MPVIIIVCALFVTLSAWKENRFAQTRHTITDTLPKKNNQQVKDFDDVLKELDKAQLELERSLKNMPAVDFDGEKMKAEIEKSMKDFDGEKLKLQVEQAMKQVDMAKVKEQMDIAMKQVDMEKVKQEIAEAMKDLDSQKLRLQVQEALVKVDMEKIKVQMEELKKMELPKIEAEMKKIKPQIDEALEKAKGQIEEAKENVKEYKAFEEVLEKDGLINKKANYSIEHKDGQLIINGKIQPQAVYNKYRSFLEKHKQFKWEKDESGLNLDHD